MSERVFWGVDIQCKIYTSILKRAHAGIVVLAVVDCVDSNSVDAQLLEPVTIESANTRGKSNLNPTNSLMSLVQILISESGSAASEDPPG